jgi:putative CocE/NonD family hydrolase
MGVGGFVMLQGAGLSSSTSVTTPGEADDTQKGDAPAPYFRAPDTDQIETSSFYLTMSDGTEIAIDLHRPKGLKGKVPTILHQTRYWRSVGIRFPFSLFIDGHFLIHGSYRRHFVERGYAWVDVDVRGTGASFGTWRHSYWPKEVTDGKEIVDWIIKQNWSDGKVGSWGISYSGGSAEFLLVNQHPAVKAAAPMYSPFDVYDDIGFPGGMMANWYIDEWNQGNQSLDANKVPVDTLLARLAARGVDRVDGNHGKAKLKAALALRSGNLDVLREAEFIEYRDDGSPSMTSLDRMSPHAYADKINGSGAPIYSYSGWYDGAYQHAAIRRFLTYDNPANRLIIGPWDHAGAHNVDAVDEQVRRFDHKNELLKFFDTHVKGMKTGLKDEPPVHYFVMREDKWRSASSWPPVEENKLELFLSDHKSLQSLPPDSDTHDSWRVDYETGTGTKTRWTGLVRATEDGIMYPERKTDHLLSYTSAPFDEAFEMIGHPVVRIFFSSSTDDASLFVYIDDVDEAGNVRYVTEGSLRAIHRSSYSSPPLYKDAVPVRDYTMVKAAPLEPGQITELEIDLLPIAWQFKPGHSLRLSFAGADIDYFRKPESVSPVLEIYSGPNSPSSLRLAPAGSRSLNQR